jgi:hypothetical protein
MLPVSKRLLRRSDRHNVRIAGRPSAETDAPEESTPAPSAEGAVFENDRFSITIAEGWDSMEIDGGGQIYKMSGEAVQVYFRGSNMSDTEPQVQTQGLAENYGGTEPQEVEKWGKTVWTTTYTANDLQQVTYLRIEEGMLVSVAAAAKDIAANADITAMLDSIVFK